MRKLTHILLKGLLVCMMITGIGVLALRAQGLNELVKTATEPAKGASKLVKEGAQPAKEVGKDLKAVTNAPTKVVKEYDKLGNEIQRTEQAYEKTGDQIKDITGADNKKDKKDQDSTSATATGANASNDKNAADGKAEADAKAAEEAKRKSAVPADFVPVKKVEPTPVATTKKVDPMDVPRPVPPGSRDNKTASGPLPASEITKPVVTGGTEPEATVVAVPAVASNEMASAESASSGGSSEEAPARYVELKTTPRVGEKRPKPDYSHSTARIPLEKAEFDIETLEELFRYSNWEGPEREHTVRSVANSLDELQQSIVEIKKLDPGQSTWRFEEAYKDMKAAYIEEMKKNK